MRAIETPRSTHSALSRGQWSPMKYKLMEYPEKRRTHFLAVQAMRPLTAACIYAYTTE